jgi:hypothetical protein
MSHEVTMDNKKRLQRAAGMILVMALILLTACAPGKRDPLVEELEKPGNCHLGHFFEYGPVTFPDGTHNALKYYCADGCVRYLDEATGANIHFCEGK